MRKRRLIRLSLAALFAVAFPTLLYSQTRNQGDNPSHIEVPFHPPADGQFADFLKSRDHSREAAESYDRLRELLKDIDASSDKRLFKELFDQNGRRRPLEELKKEEATRLLNRLRGMLQRADDPEGTLLPLLRDLDFAQKYLDQVPDGGQIKPPPNLPAPSLENQPDRARQDGPPAKQDVPNPPMQGTPQAEASRQEPNQELPKDLSSWWDRLKDTPLGKSETLRDLGRKFSRPFLRPSEPDGENWLESLARLGQHIPLKDIFSRGLPSFPKPDWSSAIPSVGAPGIGSLEAPSGGSLIGVLWTGLAVLAVVLAWKLVGARRKLAVTVDRSGWQLGPWPVNPAEVATRQDLILAFEYLSLLVFGQAARTWNHRDIAARLREQPGGVAAHRSRAADHMADLYERARYAPAADPLPEGELRDARRDLCLLAGVPGA